MVGFNSAQNWLDFSVKNRLYNLVSSDNTFILIYYNINTIILALGNISD